jgi:hypothetical protein
VRVVSQGGRGADGVPADGPMVPEERGSGLVWGWDGGKGKGGERRGRGEGNGESTGVEAVHVDVREAFTPEMGM